MFGCDEGQNMSVNKPANAANTSANAKPTSTQNNSETGNKTVFTNANSKLKPSPTPVTTEKKSDSLFSFPPPQPVDSAEIPYQDLVSGEANPTFSIVSKNLADRLEKAGYSRGKYSYFWNTDNEFAIVTRMERIIPDGTPFADSNTLEDARWNIVNHLPTAKTASDYGRYLISGKKVYYRVFAFIVTIKDPNYFSENTPPSFEMARKWHRLGHSELGGGEITSVIREVEFGKQYHCYALLYLFVNHTSLDTPKAVNDLDEGDEGLRDNLNKDVLRHLNETQIWRKDQ
jgi:hypothetical protein